MEHRGNVSSDIKAHPDSPIPTVLDKTRVANEKQFVFVQNCPIESRRGQTVENARNEEIKSVLDTNLNAVSNLRSQNYSI